MISKFSVNKPYTVVVAVIIIIILGIVSLTNISADLLPSMNLPYAVVVTTYAGGNPEEVEMAVTVPIEQTMASISNIKEISSVSSENVSFVILEFNQSTSMDSVVIEMRESLDMIKGYMPEQTGNPMILKLNPDMMPIMVLSAAVKGQDISESSSFLETKIIPELESIDGVASVSAAGLVESQVHVVLRDEKIADVNMNIAATIAGLQGLEGINAPQGNNNAENTSVQAPEQAIPQIPEISITREMVSGILKGQNFSMPAGYITEEGTDYLVRTGEKVEALEELENMAVVTLPFPGMEPVRLKDVAEIIVRDNSGSMYSKVNGNDAVILSIQKQTDYNTADVTRRLHDRIDSIMENDELVEMVPLMDQGEYIGIVVNSLSQNLIIGGILAILVLLLFLRDLKPTVIIGFAIPISLVTTFVMMYFTNITLNIISMGGLALGVGMLVDNSIVVIENIYRMRNEGKSAKEASIEGARQVSGAILASTLTTVAVFLPIVFTEGLTKQIFTDMGLTIAFSLLASLFIALTLVPMMASGILVRNLKKERRVFESIKRAYTHALRFSLRHGWLVILLALALFAGSIAGALNIGTELFPSTDTGQLTLTLEMPKGSLLEDTSVTADRISQIIMDIDEVETVGATVGGGMLGMVGMGGGQRSGGSVDSVSFYVTLKDNRSKSTDEIAQIIRDSAQGREYELSVNSSMADISALSGGTIAINIRGRDFDTLDSIARDVSAIVASVDGTVDVSDGIGETAPELMVVVDKDKSISKGLTVAQVFMEINELLTEESAATTLSVGNRDYAVFVSDENGYRFHTRNDLLQMSIPTPAGENVLLKDIASITETEGFSSIRRTNQQRYATVGAELAQGYNIGIVSDEINDLLADYQPPEGYAVEMGGERELITDSFRDLYFMLALAIAFIYLVMVAQFQSLLSPFIVMFTIPLAFTGGFLGLIVTGSPVSIVAFVGLIILSGVVVNNGIVFVDYINKVRESGVNMTDAIIKAGNDRLRPILMTALTTIFALLFLSIGAGDGTEMMQPMAITAIGGLAYATLLTLLLVPVMYKSLHKKENV